MATATTPMTTEELVAMPDDGVERWLIKGELREEGMTRRNRFHSLTMSNVATELTIWRRQLPEPRGEVLTGDAGVRVRKDPDTTFGIDVAYISPEVLAQQSEESSIIDGVPTLAVEILSPNDTVERINEKIDELLEAGTPLVWIVDPFRQTVTVYSSSAATVLYNAQQEISGEPHLPGLAIPVRRLFE